MVDFLALVGAPLGSALASAVCYRLRPCGRLFSWLYFLLLASIVAFVVVYGWVSSLTGQRLNAAVRYHLWSGLQHAGWAQFSGPLASVLASIAGLWALMGWLVLRTTRTGINASSGPWRAMAAGLLLLAVSSMPVWKDLSAASSVTAPDFGHYYRNPWILSNRSKPYPNLVYIYLEGFERTYFDEKLFPGLVRELREIERSAVSFTNVREVYGTNWTMGGIVGSQCGIPLLTPAGLFGGNSMSGIDSFLPGAIGLSDLLKGEGYHLTFLGGANVAFAGKDKFLRTHKFDEVLGVSELSSSVVETTPRNTWGLYDDTLLGLAFKKFSELSRTRQPFALFMLTVDTHFPQGHLSPSMSHVKYGDGQNPMLNAVAASDRLVSQFVRRVLSEPSGANTVIVLASDHLAMPNTATSQLKKGTRRNLFMIINSLRGSSQNDLAGSTLDIAPTVLSSLGFVGELGLGRSLFEPALQPERDFVSRDGMLQSWQEDILQFWRFPEIKEGFYLNLEKKNISIDGRVLRLPMLAAIEGGALRPMFEFDASFDKQTLKYYFSTLPVGKFFLLVVPSGQIPEIIPGRQVPGKGWSIAFGRQGGDITILQFSESRRFDARWVEMYFRAQ